MTDILDIVLPIFALIGAGYVIARTPLLSPEGVRGLTAFVFWVAIPALVFRAGMRLFDGPPLDAGVLVAFYGGVLIVFPVAMLAGRLLFRLPLPELAVFGASSTYPNNVMIGIPVAVMIYGDAALLPASAIIAAAPLAFYGSTAILIEAGRSRRADLIGIAASALLGVLKNPIVIGILLGLAFGATGAPLPAAAAAVIDLAAAAVPATALFCLGASMAGYRIAGDIAQSAFVTLMKLAVMPPVVWTLGAHLLGLDGVTLGVAVLFAALPAAANVFLLAKQHGVFVQRAGSVVLISTGLSLVTLALVIAHLVPRPG